MPKITIFEKDLTTSGIQEVTANTVYVPGYAIMGPVNTPTLCETLADFQNIFGYKPYVFREVQNNPTFSYSLPSAESFAYVGEYEKSYIYATELLSRGLPVLFERLQQTTNINWNAYSEIPFLNESGVSNSTFILSAKNPGNYGTYIQYELDQITDQELSEQININLETTVDVYTTNKQTNLYTDESLSEIAKNEEQENITISSGTELTVIAVTETAIQVSYQETIGYVNITDTDKTERVEVDPTLEAYLEAGTYVTAGRINGEQLLSSRTLTTKTNLINGDVIAIGSKLAIGSKITGNSTSTVYNNTIILGTLIDNQYVLNVSLTSNVLLNNKTGNDYGIKNTINEGPIYISFDPLNINYFKNVKSNLINITVNNYNDNLYALSTTNQPKMLTLSPNTLTGSGNLKDEFNVSDIYSMMSGSNSVSIFDKLSDKGDYQIKYLTSGSYPTFEYYYIDNLNVTHNNVITNKMLTIAGTRGDTLALIDHTNIPTRDLVGVGSTSLLSSLQALPELPILIENRREDARKYGAMFSAWGKYKCDATGNAIISTLPASFAYLECLAISTQTNENWYAVAGVTRGLIPNLLELSQPVTGAISQEMQNDKGISINPITTINPYGYCVWGNRTLNDNDGLVASSFLNVRILTNDVKKVVYAAARKLTFELNNDILWLNFRSELEPTLDRMVSGNGLRDYKIIRKASTKKATVEAIIRLYAIEAIEDWDITIELTDNYVSVQ